MLPRRPLARLGVSPPGRQSSEEAIRLTSLSTRGYTESPGLRDVRYDHRRLGIALMDHLRQRLVSGAGDRDFSGVSGCVLSVWFGATLSDLPPKRWGRLDHRPSSRRDRLVSRGSRCSVSVERGDRRTGLSSGDATSHSDGTRRREGGLVAKWNTSISSFSPSARAIVDFPAPMQPKTATRLTAT